MKRTFGFTVVELVVTLSVLAIIAAIAAPSFIGLMRGIRVDGDLSSIRTALTYARSEAINSSDFVTLCTSSAPEAAEADLECSEETEWASGWFVFVDADDDQEFDSGSDQLLRVWNNPLSANSSLVDDNSRTSITFDDEGMVAESSNVISLTLKIDGCEGQQQRQIETTLIGRLAINAEACSE